MRTHALPLYQQQLPLSPGSILVSLRSSAYQKPACLWIVLYHSSCIRPSISHLKRDSLGLIWHLTVNFKANTKLQSKLNEDARRKGSVVLDHSSIMAFCFKNFSWKTRVILWISRIRTRCRTGRAFIFLLLPCRQWGTVMFTAKLHWVEHSLFSFYSLAWWV